MREKLGILFGFRRLGYVKRGTLEDLLVLWKCWDYLIFLGDCITNLQSYFKSF